MKAWKVLGAVLALAGVVVGSGAMWIGSVAVRRKAEMERRVAGMMAEARSRDPVRPVLYGRATPGNAWDDYDRALVVVHGARDRIAVFEQFLARSPDADRSTLEKTLSTYGKAIDALQAGAHRAHGAFPSTWESGSQVRRPVLSESRFLVMFAAARARLLSEEGTSREALRLLLDALQFAHDSAQNGFEFGYASDCYQIVLEELRHQISTRPLSLDEPAELDLGLERADDSFPSAAICTKNAVLVQGVEMLKEEGHRTFNPDLPALATWRYGFSDRIVQADAFDLWCRVVDPVVIDDQGSWIEVEKAHRVRMREIHRHQNPLARFVPPSYESWARECRTKLRLVRAAIRADLDLDDPYGGRLFRSERRVWSVGWNGRDDGGDNGGDPAWAWWPRVGVVQEKDLVIEVLR